MHSPSLNVNRQANQIMHLALNKHFSVLSIELCDFNCFLVPVSEIDVSCEAVHSNCHRVTHIL